MPGPHDDRPSWIKVGVIAAIGFVVGVAWPRVVGVRLGPNAPGESSTTTAAAPRASDANDPTAPVASSAARAGASAAPAAVVAGGLATGTASAPAPSAPTPTSQISFIKPAVVSCRMEDGEIAKGATCGALPGFDAIALPKLRKLSQCATADGALGKLGVAFTVDFNTNKITASIARGSTVDNQDTFLMCVQSSFQSVSLAAIDHAHSRYALNYAVSFTPRPGAPAVAANKPGAGARNVPPPAVAPLGTAPAAPGAPPVPVAAAPALANGATAQVMWEVAIVRDAPRTGAVVARLQRGAQVQVGRGQEGWFHVNYGAGFATEGWVYRGSIGR